jgi:hypothetical protein
VCVYVCICVRVCVLGRVRAAFNTHESVSETPVRSRNADRHLGNRPAFRKYIRFPNRPWGIPEVGFVHADPPRISPKRTFPQHKIHTPKQQTCRYSYSYKYFWKMGPLRSSYLTRESPCPFLFYQHHNEWAVPWSTAVLSLGICKDSKGLCGFAWIPMHL